MRPGLERVRDLAVEGQIQAVLALSPDRLSRKYAYQVLLIEELGRHGVQVVFVKAPQSDTPEDQLLLQFQGMIAEYERAQILERSRRGKRHRARQGEVNVLSGAPYGYRYVRKSEERAGYYELKDQPDRSLAELHRAGAAGYPDDLERTVVAVRITSDLQQLPPGVKEAEAGLKRHSERAIAVDVDRHADDPPGRLANVLLARREECPVRAAVPERHAEPL